MNKVISALEKISVDMLTIEDIFDFYLTHLEDSHIMATEQ